MKPLFVLLIITLTACSALVEPESTREITQGLVSHTTYAWPANPVLFPYHASLYGTTDAYTALGDYLGAETGKGIKHDGESQSFLSTKRFWNLAGGEYNNIWTVDSIQFCVKCQSSPSVPGSFSYISGQFNDNASHVFPINGTCSTASTQVCSPVYTHDPNGAPLWKGNLTGVGPTTGSFQFVQAPVTATVPSYTLSGVLIVKTSELN